MYWCRFATKNDEEIIHRLNYETFVEEIPQHAENEARLLVDKFHTQNMYLLVLYETTVVGMVAFREVRPFSIDQKIGPVETHLQPALCEKLCELRLLTVMKAHRNGRALLALIKALYGHFYERGYTAVVISGTVREEKMYKEIGFTQFAEAVGTAEARYLPMVLTQEAIAAFRARIITKRRHFYPGPVAQKAIEAPTISHRSIDGQALYEVCVTQLKTLAKSRYVALVNGSGTLANDVMIGAVKAKFQQQPGVVISNGEFGQRLALQATQWGLTFTHLEYATGQAFDCTQIEKAFQQASWCLFVHGETSSGTLNPLESLIDLAQRYEVALCADCISTFGALPFSCEALYMATATSGKALGSVAGLGFLFYNEEPAIAAAPQSLQLAHYHERIPYTLPMYLVAHVVEALRQYPARFAELEARLTQVLQSPLYEEFAVRTTHYPMVVSLQAEALNACAKMNGFDLHADSVYLQKLGYAQISVIQPTFTRDFTELTRWYEQFRKAGANDKYEFNY